MKLQTAAWNFQAEGFASPELSRKTNRLSAAGICEMDDVGVSEADGTWMLADVKGGDVPKVSEEASIQG